jgi:hypothetical protein
MNARTGVGVVNALGILNLDTRVLPRSVCVMPRDDRI